MLWISCCKARDSCHFTHDRCALPDLASSNKILLHSSSSSAFTICDERLSWVLAIFLLILTLYSLLFCYPTFFLVDLLKRLKINLLNLCKSKCSIFLAQPIVQIFNFLRTKFDLNDYFLHFYIVLDYDTVVLNLINKLVRFSNLFQNRLTNNEKI